MPKSPSFSRAARRKSNRSAQVLAADPNVDLAILKAVDVKSLPHPIDCNPQRRAH